MQEVGTNLAFDLADLGLELRGFAALLSPTWLHRRRLVWFATLGRRFLTGDA